MPNAREKERKRETLTVLTLLVEALSHMSQSHSITLSPSPSLESSSSHPSINYIPPTKTQTPHHSIAILEKNQKLDLLQGTKKELFCFFFLQNVKLVLYGSLRIHATDVVLHGMQVLPPTVTYCSTLLQYRYYKVSLVRYLLVGKVVQFDLTQTLAVRTPFSRYKTTIYLTLASLT